MTSYRGWFSCVLIKSRFGVARSSAEKFMRGALCRKIFRAKISMVLDMEHARKSKLKEVIYGN